MFNWSSKFQDFKVKRKGEKCQLFRATDFQSLMYPCFTFSRILGIFPYKINASTIKICKPSYVLSTIIICVFCVYQLINIYRINISKKTIHKSVPRTLQINCFYIFGSFIAITTYILSGQRMRSLQTILEFSLRLPPKSFKNLSKWLHIKDTFGFFLLMAHGLINLSRMQLSIFHVILATYTVLLVFQMDMLYMNCVCVLKACFKQINDNLENIRELVVHDKPYLVKETFHEQRNPFLLMELKALKKRYLAISDTVQTLNMVFRLQLLCTIIITFIQITIHLFFYLIQMHKSVPTDNLKRVYYDYFIICATYHIIKMVLIVWACETCKDQAMEINTTVHNVLNSTNDEQMKYELRLFSLQLKHCKNIFSAKGLIVDAKLLTAMVGNITTYGLILFQFMLMLDSCDEKALINFLDIKSSLVIKSK